MRVVIQRVSEAKVTVKGEIISAIGKGLLILVGVEEGDSEKDMEWLASKCAVLRIFPDQKEIMNLSIKDIKGEILVVSQFTLTASTKKGNRPSYIRAARPEQAVILYDKFCEKLISETGCKVKKGLFGADMQVALINEGPVTIIMDSRLRE